MSICQTQFSQVRALNEQIAREIFDILPEDGPIVMIIGRDGSRFLSNPTKLSELGISESFLKEVCAKIDDGAEPVITRLNDFGVVAMQLVTEQINYGYVIVALPQYNPESVLINIGLIEMLLNQIALIARLIEQSRPSCGFPTNRLNMSSHSNIASD
jgi:hypothetical protein